MEKSAILERKKMTKNEIQGEINPLSNRMGWVQIKPLENSSFPSKVVFFFSSMDWHNKVTRSCSYKHDKDEVTSILA